MKMYRLHYLQHISFEGPGYIETWAKRNGCAVTGTKIYEHQPLPGIEAFDCLVVMGGPMGVYDESLYPWLKSEKKLIKLAIEAHKFVIGICLGAQLIAEILGAKVFPAQEREIGWFPVSLTAAALQNTLFKSFPESFPALHWHNDTFDLPEGSERLMYTEACANQAFIYRQHVLGLQFHLEASPNTLRDMLSHSRQDLIPGKYVQTEKQLLKNAGLYRQTNAYLTVLFDKMLFPDRSSD